VPLVHAYCVKDHTPSDPEFLIITHDMCAYMHACLCVLHARQRQLQECVHVEWFNTMTGIALRRAPWDELENALASLAVGGTHHNK
jgi:hypothetical protein